MYRSHSRVVVIAVLVAWLVELERTVVICDVTGQCEKHLSTIIEKIEIFSYSRVEIPFLMADERRRKMFGLDRNSRVFRNAFRPIYELFYTRNVRDRVLTPRAAVLLCDEDAFEA